MKKCVWFLLLILGLIGSACAETKYVLVRSELNVRAKPSLGSHIHGRLYTGDSVQVFKTYRGWLFLENLPSEEGCGWISEQYVVNEPVTQMDEVPATVCGNGRVAVRNSVNGKRTSWVYPGETVYVYGMSDSWTVTNRGYVKTEYLTIQR